MSELKSCPMCESQPAFFVHSAGFKGTMGFDSWHAVTCKGCGCTMGASDRRFRSKDEAATAWNLRPTVRNSRIVEPSDDAIKEVALYYSLPYSKLEFARAILALQCQGAME